MSVVFRADGKPVASRPDHWHHVVEETFGPLRLRPPSGAQPPHRLVVGDVGAVRVAELKVAWTTPSARCQGARTPRLISQAGPQGYRVDLVVRGRMVVEQDGREAWLGPGDFSVMDLSRPARWATSAEHTVAMLFPRTMLPLPRDQVAWLTAVRVPGDQGPGALVAPVARRLAGHLGDDYGADDGARLGTAVLDLLTAALAARLESGQRVPQGSRRRVLLQRVHAYIEQHLGDPGLAPGTIAAAHHVSVRYLYKLFEAQGQGVAGHIRRRRLERCRRDLLDPALLARPVGAIGARWGLPDPASFSRAFRAAYGIPPGEYRNMGDGSSRR
jgi:AraC-like DNA-binding protein